MRIDENGVWHPQMIDEVTKETSEHIINCDECSQIFNTAKIRQYTMSDEFTPKRFIPTEDRRFVEDDLMQLQELDNRIRELFAQREERIQMIRKQNAQNEAMLVASEDWFEGDIRGNPVPARDPGPTEPRSEFRLKGYGSL